MSALEVLQMLTISLQAFTILFHSLGIYLLRRLFVKGNGDVQYVFIFNLSLIEIFATTALLVEVVIDLKMAVVRHYEIGRQVLFYLSIISFTFCSLYIVSNMIFIVVEKALEVRLDIRHSVYCNVRKAKYLEVMTLLTSFGICVGVLIAFHTGYRGFVVEFATYIVPTYYVILIISIVVSVTFIASRYYKNADLSLKTTTKSTKISNGLKVFRHSRFFIPSCLIVTFLLLNVIPDFILFYRVISGGDIFKRDMYVTVRFLLYTISFICDAYVYIFLDKNVRLLLQDQFRTMSCQSPDEGDTYSVSTKMSEVVKAVNFQDMAMDLQVI